MERLEMLPQEKVVQEIRKHIHARHAGATPGTVRPLLTLQLPDHHALGWRAGAAHCQHAALRAAGHLCEVAHSLELEANPIGVWLVALSGGHDSGTVLQTLGMQAVALRLRRWALQKIASGLAFEC